MPLRTHAPHAPHATHALHAPHACSPPSQHWIGTTMRFGFQIFRMSNAIKATGRVNDARWVDESNQVGWNANNRIDENYEPLTPTAKWTTLSYKNVKNWFRGKPPDEMICWIFVILIWSVWDAKLLHAELDESNQKGRTANALHNILNISIFQQVCYLFMFQYLCYLFIPI